MDVALLFVLPLIGGFAFVTQFSLLRYRTGREESQRLYYRAALYGLVFAVIAGAVHYAARTSWTPYPVVIDRIATNAVLPLLEKDRISAAAPATPAISQAAARARTDLAAICLYAFVFGALVPVWNLVLRFADWLWVGGFWEGGYVHRSFLSALNLRAITDQLERLITESLVTATPVQITLSNSKVYVGAVLESPDPASPAKYFKIQPWMSGHRSADTGKVDFNTFYDNVLAGLEADEAERRAATFQLVIPIDKVVSASGFDFDAYEQFVLEQGATERAAAGEASLLKPGPVDVMDALARKSG
jgi:hypothetical protein